MSHKLDYDYSTDTQISVASITNEIRPTAASVQLVQILPNKLFSIAISFYCWIILLFLMNQKSYQNISLSNSKVIEIKFIITVV